MMQKAIKACHGQEGIAKKIKPLGWGTVGSEQDTALLIALSGSAKLDRVSIRP
jgi:hypothetical protein